jgi:hypothetical protein
MPGILTRSIGARLTGLIVLFLLLMTIGAGLSVASLGDLASPLREAVGKFKV